MAKNITYNHYGRVNNGILAHYNHPLFQQTIKLLEGKEFVMILKEKHKKISLDTHGFYRGGIIKECLEYEMFGGWDEDQLHDFFADMFLSYTQTLIVKRDAGEPIIREVRRVQSTSSLSQKEMNEFVDKVLNWLGNEGIIIQSPESYFLGKYKSIER